MKKLGDWKKINWKLWWCANTFLIQTDFQLVFFESSSTQKFKTMTPVPNSLIIDIDYPIDYPVKKDKKEKFKPTIILNDQKLHKSRIKTSLPNSATRFI